MDFLEFKHENRHVECVGDCHVTDKPTSFFCIRIENYIRFNFFDDWLQTLPHKTGWKVFQSETPIADCTKEVCGRWTCHFQQLAKGPIIHHLVIRCGEPWAPDLSASIYSRQQNAEGGPRNKNMCRRTPCSLEFSVTEFSEEALAPRCAPEEEQTHEHEGGRSELRNEAEREQGADQAAAAAAEEEDEEEEEELHLQSKTRGAGGSGGGWASGPSERDTGKDDAVGKEAGVSTCNEALAN